mgnify:FL=1
MPMADQKTFRISVNELVEITLKKGSLSRTYVSRDRAVTGIHEHNRLQELRPDTFQREVTVSLRVTRHDIDLDVHGRIDGVETLPGRVIIEEIKTCTQDPAILAAAPKETHMAQLKCYGYMYLKTQDLTSATLKLTYSNVQTQEVLSHEQEADIETLELFFLELAYQYIDMLFRQSSWSVVRNRSIMDMPFAYEEFRPNQRDLSVAVYQAIKHDRILFAKAPTGTGKTIATLFPAIKSLGMNQTDRIFYLTAKTIGRTVAEKALNDMRKQGLAIKSITLTAKQKICFSSDEGCDMDHCPYASNYYSKLHRALEEALESDAFDREFIEETAQKHMICPFELSLDLCLSCDVIICDLNYAFDPRVYLKRFFDNKAQHITFLMDEAHNLPDRLRSMYSAQISKSHILEIRRAIKDDAPKLADILTRLNTLMLEMRKTCEKLPDEFQSSDTPDEPFMALVREFTVHADAWLDTHGNSPVKDPVMDLYFECYGFLVISEYFDDHYRFVLKKEDTDLTAKLFCIDPSRIFSELIQKAGASILFSATLYPFEYYISLLFKPEIETTTIMIPSAFPKENLLPLIFPSIKTTYRERERSMADLAGLIRETIIQQPGNYLVFFPSYAYMDKVAGILEEDLEDLLVQTPQMSEPDKEIFLEQFAQDSQTTGFAVMGGIFGEGIDLEGDRLVGVIIVSVGIPQVNPEQNLIKTYYDQTLGNGFFYAYQMPGFCRVLQAAGRLIRTETDKGMALFIDQRFMRPDYLNLFPQEYRHALNISSSKDLLTTISDFWSPDPISE